MQAYLKGVSRRVRYMALPHRQELLELALDAFASSKNERMHELLVQVGTRSGWFRGTRPGCSHSAALSGN